MVGTDLSRICFWVRYRAVGQRSDEFTFGFPSSWVLAPEREGAHNWEGTGYQTAMHALGVLETLSRTHPVLSKSPADSSRVIFAGHSRGGHGAYMTSQHHGDRAVGVAALSGWWRREQYADANILFDLDLQLSFLDPVLRGKKI